jgi:hypothetical protein
MTDHTVGLSAGPARLLRRLAGLLWARTELPPRMLWPVIALIGLVTVHYFWRSEGELANVLFTVAVTFAIVATLAAVSRRLFFATVLSASMVAVVVAVASVKRATMNMVAHAYDLFFYFSSWSTLSFLWNDHRRYVLALLGALAAMGFLGWLAYRVDGTRVPRRWAGLAVVGFAVLAWAGAQAKGERRHMQFYYENLYVSSFYASWGETLEALWRGTLLEASPHLGTRPFALDQPCHVASKPPHIILIHQESVVPPSYFPTLSYDPGVDAFFQSTDGRLHKLRVETYGGASWLTEFSLLAGVSTHYFGGMRPFVQTFTQNKLKDTLPQALERCGYRNIVFYPMLRNFVSNDRFYSSIALKEIFDAKAQNAKRWNERDRFYYSNALNEMERHFKSSSKPLFTFIQTMAAHWPYDVTYMPEEKVAGGGPGTPAEMHEYLRRLSMAKLDYDYFLREIQRRFPNQQFLIVHYGDHHPLATRVLLGFDQDTEAEDVKLDPNSIGFLTYYAVRGINYRVPQLPAHDVLDVSYLGTVILDLARLPLSESHRERKRLMDLCHGRYFGCSKQEEILIFHRRLIDSGVIAAG